MLPERETMTKVVHKNISQKVLKRLGINNTSQKKMILKRPYMTLSELILHFIKKSHLLNVSIHRNFYQNRYINECAR